MNTVERALSELPIVDTNAAVLITRTGEHETGLMSKEELAKVILEKAAELL